MLSRLKMRYLSMHLRRKAANIAMRIALVGVISVAGCGGDPMHNCTSCGLGAFRIVIVSFPGGGQSWGQADGDGCMTVSTRAACGEVVFTPV